jgi:hypothetical protein
VRELACSVAVALGKVALGAAEPDRYVGDVVAARLEQQRCTERHETYVIYDPFAAIE